MARVSLPRKVDKGGNMELSPADQLYAAAYAAHYTNHDLSSAFRIYRELLASYPNEKEADYARMQIHNIIWSVVPEQELLDVQIELALFYMELDRELRATLLATGSSCCDIVEQLEQLSKVEQ